MKMGISWLEVENLTISSIFKNLSKCK